MQISIAKAKRAEQDAITAAKEGEAKAAEEKWKQEAVKAQKVTEASEVTEGGAVQAARPMGTEAPFEETEPPMAEEEEYPEEEGTEDLSEQLQE